MDDWLLTLVALLGGEEKKDIDQQELQESADCLSC
jgi:hypothetical protein